MRKILYRTTLGLSAVALAESGAGVAQASPVVEEEYYGFSVKMAHEGSLDGLEGNVHAILISGYPDGYSPAYIESYNCEPGESIDQEGACDLLSAHEVSGENTVANIDPELASASISGTFINYIYNDESGEFEVGGEYPVDLVVTGVGEVITDSWRHHSSTNSYSTREGTVSGTFGSIDFSSATAVLERSEGRAIVPPVEHLQNHDQMMKLFWTEIGELEGVAGNAHTGYVGLWEDGSGYGVITDWTCPEDEVPPTQSNGGADSNCVENGTRDLYVDEPLEVSMDTRLTGATAVGAMVQLDWESGTFKEVPVDITAVGQGEVEKFEYRQRIHEDGQIVVENYSTDTRALTATGTIGAMGLGDDADDATSGELEIDRFVSIAK